MKNMSEETCYQVLYGDLIDCVPHYAKKDFWRLLKVPKDVTLHIHVGSGAGGGGGTGGWRYRNKRRT